MIYDAYETGLRAYNLRLSQSKKQNDVSDAIGISQSSYSRFESGSYDMPLSEVIKLCNYLGVTVSWLIGEDKLPPLTASEQLELNNYINFILSKRK